MNKGTNYEGTTVFLDSDLSLDEEFFEPIGYYKSWNDYNYFLGVFDGQGHTISDLNMNSSSQYVGLFGYSYGLPIKNVILDSSCSIASSRNSNEAYIGGIIGRCYANNGPCAIENTVNMGSVTFNGNKSNYLHLGGISGRLTSSYEFSFVVKNCANYGDVTGSGEGSPTYIGGIVGYSQGGAEKSTSIVNCLNYGTITNNNTKSSGQNIGRITGYTDNTAIVNSVGVGKIITSNSAGYIGGIAGYIWNSEILHCYWDKDTTESAYGSMNSGSVSNSTSFDSATFELSESVSVGDYTGTSLLEALNAFSGHYYLRDYSNWALNRNSNTVTFTINGRTNPITLNSQIILLPSLASEGVLWFDEWYTDTSCESPLESFEITSGMELYGKWGENPNSYTITFDTRREGISIEPITAQYLSVVSLPNSTLRDNCEIGFWENEYGDNVSWDFTVPAHNLTLHAVWSCTVIRSAADLVDLSKVVNSGKNNFEGATVFLDSGIVFTDELSRKFEMIGDYEYNFLGTFDGQGHIISNLEINSSSEYTGLFKYSDGSTIKNVVMDSSCSIASCKSDSAKIGGIIGSFESIYGLCLIENIVNMANVYFYGNSGGDSFYMGGIVGHLSSTEDYEITVKNCANYGSISHAGLGVVRHIGGIVGYSEGDSSKLISIQNCFNHGTILNNNMESSGQYIGGVVGYTEFTIIENCVSAGKITSKCSSDYIGGIAGYIYFSSQISNCYCDKVVENIFGLIDSSSISGSSNFDSSSFELNESVSIGDYTGTSLLEALNAAADYYYLRDYSHWALNRNNNTVSFTINGRTNPSITLNSQIILLPSLAIERVLWFDGWYTDTFCASPLASFEITSDKELYGKWGENPNSYTITFDTRGGTPIEPITAKFGSVVSLPRDTDRDNCAVAWWEDDYGDIVSWNFVVPAHNLTLHAVWSCTVIRSAVDLVDFSSVVNYGTSDFSGTTVFLGSDVDFTDELSQQFEPIGKDYHNFLGIFDGQGHTISNLKLKTSSFYAGLFGCSDGTTIKNVVMDSSCSVTSSRVSSSYRTVHSSGIIGKCYSSSGSCIIENAVNMASVIFNGNLTGHSDTLYLGGIAGYLSYSSYEISVKNCVNYGTVSIIGPSESVYAGGIVGCSYGKSSATSQIQNCINYGSIMFSGSPPSELNIGGISGGSSQLTIYNCVSAGNLPSIPASKTGVIIGDAGWDMVLNHCLWTNDVECDKEAGTGTPDVTNSSLVSSLDSTVIAELNDYADSNDELSKWVMLYTNEGIINNLEQDKPVVGLLKSLPVPAKEGHTLLFWCVDEECNNKYEPDVTLTSEVTSLYAHWVISNYTVTFEGNGGIPSKNSTVVAYNSSYGDLPKAERTGYSFIGWFTEKDGGDNVMSEEVVKITEDQTLYAHWNINQYTLTFEVNGGSACGEIKQDYNTAVVLPKPTRTGYSFVHWCSDTDLAKEYTETTMPAEDKTLYALWTINQYTITFVFNNGTENEVRTLVFNQEIVYPEGVEKTGYTFIKWENKQDRMPAENITITAQWVANVYTVTFDVNGGNALSESEKTRNVTYDSTYGDLPTPTKEGYGFDGWFTEAEEGEKINSTTVIKILNDQTIYAHWTAGAITVTFNATGGSSTQSSMSVSFDGVYGDLPSATKTGYIFGGWFTAAVDGDEVTSETRVTDSNHLTLYAHWTADEYNVAFDVNGGNPLSAYEQTKKVSYDSPYGDLPVASRIGYDFVGWFTENEGGENVTSEDIVQITEDQTFYAHWRIKQYTITFKSDGAIIKSEKLDYGSIITYPSSPSKTGHTFVGWDSEITTVPDHDVTVNVKWTINQYIITFIFRNGDEPEIRTIPYNASIEYPKNMTREEFTFAGWYEDANFSTPFNETTMPAQSITLYAKWTSIDTWEPVTSIANASDFVQFARSVKHLDGYCGSTVFIEKNVDMDGVLLEPIDGFCGTLDGQGHKISNLRIRSTRNHVGLFGMSGRGATVRNIAFDSSCLVESNNNSSSKKKRNNSRRGTGHEGQDTVHIGSVFGACQSSEGNTCVVENVVSSANVSLPSSGMEAFVGGIYGSCRGNCAIRNAIYTGSIRVSGGGTGVVSGGIAGYCSNCTIEESENHGAMAVGGAGSGNVVSGGIVGVCENSLVARCMSTGGADSGVSAGIAGNASGSSSITQCYWSEEMSGNACNCAGNDTANVTDSYSFNKDLTLNDGRSTPL